MKQIGLIGGMSWESTQEYYRIINQTVKQRLGGWHSARLLLVSVDFDEIEQHQRNDDWAAAAAVLTTAAWQLERGGADFFLICTNTMHKVATQIESAVHIPLVHIAEATAAAIEAAGLDQVGLLGTRFTMEEDFLKGYLTSRHGIDVVIPDEADRRQVHAVIYDELCLGRVNPASRKAFVDIIGRLEARGARGVVLGCTEIPLLVSAEDVTIPVFDTTTIHAMKAVDLALTEA
jgi:aspartate racemase